MGSRILYLVRHGQYHMDEKQPRYGSLTALGRRQAERTGKRLAELPIEVIHHSDMLRAVETAEIVARHLPKRPLCGTPLLREGLPPVSPQWAKKHGVSRRDMLEMKQRMDAAYAKFFRSTRRGDRHELLVAHGNLIRYLVRRALSDRVQDWWKLGTSQCSITIVSIGKCPFLIGYNDIGHLPAPMQTLL